MLKAKFSVQKWDLNARAEEQTISLLLFPNRSFQILEEMIEMKVYQPILTYLLENWQPNPVGAVGGIRLMMLLIRETMVLGKSKDRTCRMLGLHWSWYLQAQGTRNRGFLQEQDPVAARNRSQQLSVSPPLSFSLPFRITAFHCTFLDYYLYHLATLAHSYFIFIYNFCLCLLVNLSMHIFTFFSTLPFGISQFRCSRERI